MLRIIQNRKIFFIISATLVTLSIVVLAMWGLNLGIDFTGGSLMEIEFSANRPNAQQITEILSNADLNLGEIRIQPSGESGMIIRTRDLSEVEHQAALQILRDSFENTHPTSLEGEFDSGEAQNTQSVKAQQHENTGNIELNEQDKEIDRKSVV